MYIVCSIIIIFNAVLIKPGNLIVGSCIIYNMRGNACEKERREEDGGEV